jgi:putative DNA primase/helicase
MDLIHEADNLHTPERMSDGPRDNNSKPNTTELDADLVVHSPIGLLDNTVQSAEVIREPAKTPASQGDPATEALKFLESTMLDGVSRLRFWAGAFWCWESGKYTEQATNEVQASLTRHLNERYTFVKTTHTANLLAQVKALSLLPSTHQPPYWIGHAGKDLMAWRPEDILIAENGIVHLPSLTTGQPNYMADATPALFATSALDYAFDIGASCPTRWLGFLAQLWPDDPDSIATLQEWFGYLLTPDTRLQKMLLLIGPKRSGKGTIARIMQAVIGEGNVCGPTLSSLATNFGLWPLLGNTAAIISDARLSGRSDQAVITERLLSISGEDAQTIDRKNLKPVTTKLQTRFTIISNEIPRLNDSSGAFAARFVVLRLSESFYGREDTKLTEILLEERSGILLWAIEGWRRLRDRGHFLQPQSGADVREVMDDLSSPMLAFIRECCVIGDSNIVRVSELYAAWQEWCRASGRDTTTTEQTFGRDLLAAVPRLRKTQPRDGYSRYRAYQGIGLRPSSQYL